MTVCTFTKGCGQEQTGFASSFSSKPTGEF